MTYKVIYELAPMGYFLDFISCHCTLIHYPQPYWPLSKPPTFQIHSHLRAFVLVISCLEYCFKYYYLHDCILLTI